jgi:holo-[acyl-carrier protein] synthase
LDETWTRAEQTDVGDDDRRLAGRWAVKEAVMKALGVGLGEIGPLDIEVRTRKSGALFVILHRFAKRTATSRGIASWHASLSYGGNWALGLAVGVRDLSPSANQRRPAATTTRHRRSIAI